MKAYTTLAALTVLMIAGFFFVQPPLTPEAGATLPPRDPTVTPTVMTSVAPDSPVTTGSSGPVGAYLVLQDAQPGAWSMVQWQDSNGHWQQVDGWQGEVGVDGRVVWWVSRKDFGTGPFRWLVDGSATAPFYLPSEANTWQVVR